MNEPQPNEEFRHPGDPEGVVRDADGHIIDHSKCPARWHDFDPRGADGQQVDERGRRLCNHGDGALTFYCQGTNWYHHAGVDTPACFLVQEDGHAVNPPAYVLTLGLYEGNWVATVAGPNHSGDYINEADWPRRVVATLQGGPDYFRVKTPEGVDIGALVKSPHENLWMAYAPDAFKVPALMRSAGVEQEDALVALLADYENPAPLTVRREQQAAQFAAEKAQREAAGYGPRPGAVTVLQQGGAGAHLEPRTEYVVTYRLEGQRFSRELRGGFMELVGGSAIFDLRGGPDDLGTQPLPANTIEASLAVPKIRSKRYAGKRAGNTIRPPENSSPRPS